MKKNERITNVFRIAGVQSTQQSGITRVQRSKIISLYKILYQPRHCRGTSVSKQTHYLTVTLPYAIKGCQQLKVYGLLVQACRINSHLAAFSQ